MKPLLIIIALLTEPGESILEIPWDYVQEYEFIEPKSLEQIERELERKRYRIMEARPDER